MVNHPNRSKVKRIHADSEACTRINGWTVRLDAGDEWSAIDIDEDGEHHDRETFARRSQAVAFAKKAPPRRLINHTPGRVIYTFVKAGERIP